ncbi:MAG: FAD-dependent oxidoreductase [Desulfobacterales bacterium]|nr:FAD-dependent oxidoreductase [Desulfobacterales bacterium]
MNRREFVKQIASGALLSGIPSIGIPLKKSWGAQSSTYDAVIIGGGLSGLTAAVGLKDYNILILEKEGAMGGRIVSKTWEGFSYSLGASYLGKPDSEMLDFFDAIGLTSKPFPVPPPQDAIGYQGRIYPEDYADQALGSLKAVQDYVRITSDLFRLAEEGIAEAVYDVDIKGLRSFSHLDQISVRQWLEQNNVHPVVQKLFNIENRGLFGAANEDVSLLYNIPEMAFNFYEGDEVPDRFEERALPDFHQYRSGGYSGEKSLWTFTHGMIEIIWAIENQRKLRNRQITGATVQSVAVNPDKTVEIVYKKSGRTYTVKSYAVILATPAPITLDIVKNGFSDSVTGSLQKITYSPYITMGIFMDRRLFRNAWNIACLDTVFSTLNDAVRTHVDYDYGGKSILGVAVPPKSSKDRSYFNKSDHELFTEVLRDIERYFPKASGRVLGRYIHRFTHGFPVFMPGYMSILRSIHNDLSTSGPLFLAGDYTVYPTLGGAAISGERAYENVEEYFDAL